MKLCNLYIFLISVTKILNNMVLNFQANRLQTNIQNQFN